MKPSSVTPACMNFARRSGFSLIEVVLAIGIFLVTVLALVGLLGPTLKSVDEVEKTDEVASIVNTVNAFLQSSPDIATADASKFDIIYNMLQTDVGAATIFVYRWYDDAAVGGDGAPVIKQEIGFSLGSRYPIGDLARVNAPIRGASYDQAAGPLYRVILTASSVTPEASLQSKTRDGSKKIYLMKDQTAAEYPEGYLALEVRIFDQELTSDVSGTLEVDDRDGIVFYANIEPIFTYNTAIVR